MTNEQTTEAAPPPAPGKQEADTAGHSEVQSDNSGTKRKGPPRVLLALLVVAIAGAAIWWFFLRGPEVPEGVIQLSGRIEGDDAAVAAKIGGRVREVTVREGDVVKAGQVIAILDDEQIRARETQAQAALRQAEARVNLAQQQIGVLNQQLRQNELTIDQSRQDANGRVQQAKAQVAGAEASLAEAEAAYKLAVFDQEAYTRLAKVGAVSERQGRQANSTAESQRALVDALRRQVEASRGALVAAEANLTNPDIRSAQTAAVRQQILQAQADVAVSQAEAGRARAELTEASANRSDLQVIAPFVGTVITRSVEPGEYVGVGTGIVTLLNLQEVYLRGFIPEGQIGRVRVGQPGRVYLDSNVEKPLEAEVSRIDPQASFTPENTYFRDDRVKQVVGVKLRLKASQGYAKPGMPADGEVLVEGSSWPASRR